MNASFAVFRKELWTAVAILLPTFGFGMGFSYASSRAYFASLFPNEESGRFFGLYTFSERAASTVGPLFWGAIVYSLAVYAPWNYRLAVLTMAFLIFSGGLVLFKRGDAIGADQRAL